MASSILPNQQREPEKKSDSQENDSETILKEKIENLNKNQNSKKLKNENDVFGFVLWVSSFVAICKIES